MLSIILGVLTFALIVVSLFLILVVLAQKSKSDGGVGAAMGGGMAEATFGADTSNVLSKMTIWAAILFFSLSLALYMGRLYEARSDRGGGALPAASLVGHSVGSARWAVGAGRAGGRGGPGEVVHREVAVRAA